MKKIKQDVDTRWNSTFKMLESYNQQKEEITTILCLQRKEELCLSSLQQDCLENTLTILEPFNAATVEVSSEKFTSLSKVIPIVKQLLKKSESMKCSLGIRLKENLLNYFSSIEDKEYLRMATVLDPRFKKGCFRNAQDLAERDIRNHLEKLHNCRSLKDIETASTPSPQPKRIKSSLWDDFDEEMETNENDQEEKQTPVDIEMKFYMDSKRIQRHENPLEWWKSNQQFLPLMSVLAKKYLGIPATSVPSERVFSKAGELVSAKRSTLKKENVDMLLFLNKDFETVYCK